MKDIIANVADQFYEKIISNQFFSSFFIGKDFEKIKNKVKDFIHYQITCGQNEKSFQMSYNLGVIHAEIGIPLNTVLNFFDHIQQSLYIICEQDADRCSSINTANFAIMRNSFAKGYLHETIKNTDMMSIPLFSVLSTTKIATTIIAWIIEIHDTIICETEPEKIYPRTSSCALMSFLNKPFFNMIFENEDNFFEFNMMHLELHNTANSLLYFMEEKNYVQAHYVYNDFVEQCKSFMNYYFERVVLFTQNNENYFYRFASKKASNNKNMTIFTFNIRNMNMINKVWGHDNGDFLVHEVERKIDKLHGMNSNNSVYIKTNNAEFIVLILNQNEETSKKLFDEMLIAINKSIPVRGEFNSDLKISSAYIPLGEKASEYISHLKEIINQAITQSKTSDNIPLICNHQTIINFNTMILQDEKIKYFIRQSFNKDNFKPYYHSIINAKDESVAHIEVLARVCDGDSCISAGSFIDYLVQTERIIELDKVMLDKVTEDVERLKEIATAIFINISPKSLRSPSYVNKLNTFIKFANNNNLGTVFEITEQSLFDNIEIVRELHEKYETIFAIDDFGSGYSNFSIVSDLAQEGLIRYLKIDGSLIKDININVYKENIVAGIIRIAESLDLKTVAEFVSDKETAEKLKSLGVSHLQGFYYAVPKPLKEY